MKVCIKIIFFSFLLGLDAFDLGFRSYYLEKAGKSLKHKYVIERKYKIFFNRTAASKNIQT